MRQANPRMLFSKSETTASRHSSLIVAPLSTSPGNIKSKRDMTVKNQTQPMLTPTNLSGEAVNLEPLSSLHFERLCAVGLDEDIWRWMPTGAPTTEHIMAWLEQALEEQRKGT